MDRRKKTRKKSDSLVTTSSQKSKGNAANKSDSDSATKHGTSSLSFSSAQVDWSLNRLARFGIFAAFFLFVWWFFAGRYHDLLYVSGSQDGFYLEWQTLTGCLAYIALPLELITSLIMQLFLFPAVGGLVIALLAILLLAFAAKCISTGPYGIVHAVAIVLFLFYVMVGQGYYIFGFRSFAFFFQAFIGLTIAFALVVGYTKCKHGLSRIIYVFASIVLFYPLIGSFALCTAMYELKAELSEIHTDAKGESLRRLHESMAAYLTIVTLVTPLLWYPIYSGRIPICMLYAHNFCYREIALVDLGMIMLNRVYGGVLAFLLLLPVFATTMKFLQLRRAQSKTVPVDEQTESASTDTDGSRAIAVSADAVDADISKRRTIPLGCIATVLGMSCLSVMAVVFARHDDTFMTSLAMWRPFENSQWEKIIELESKLKESLLPLIELRRQAQLETGQLPQHYFERGYKYDMSDDLIEISSFQIYGMELLIRNGNINHGYRMAMNNFQFRRNQSPRLMKILFMGALVNEEYPLAKRYLDRLKKIPFRQPWCKKWEKILDYCSQYEEHKDSDKLKSLPDDLAQEVKRVYLMRSLRPDTDYLGGDDTHYYPCVTYAARFRNIKNIPRPWQEQQLLHVIVLRDFKLYRSKFAVYYEGLLKNGITEVPEVFQMGLIYCHFIETGRCECPPEYQCSPVLIVRFRDYAMYMARYQQSHDQEALQVIDKNYSNTCWYAIDFGQDYMLY